MPSLHDELMGPAIQELSDLVTDRDDAGNKRQATIKPPIGDPVLVDEWIDDDRLQAKSQGVLDLLSSTLSLHVQTHLLPQRILPLTSKVKVLLASRPNEVFSVDENATQVGGAVSTIGLVAATQTGLARHTRSIS